MFHHPVLFDKVIFYLKIKKGGLYIDATFGEGGYALEILKRGGRVLGIDIDINQLKKLKRLRVNELTNLTNLKLIQGNFKDIERIAKENKFFPVDGVIFDLGLSIRQLTESKKGFSYKNEEEPLDMRLDPTEEKTAADYLNHLSEQELYELFAGNSEEINSRVIAISVVQERKKRRIEKVGDLVRIINKVLNREDEKTLARIFQALRIEVNHEFDNLKKGLEGAKNILKKEGRILVLSFHSLEDRIVKRFVRENKMNLETEKPVTAKNGYLFERSAKLRIISNS